MNLKSDSRAPPVVAAMRLMLCGQVQGIGMRPAIARLADQLGLAGRVWNSTGGVEVHVEGPQLVVDQFVNELPRRLPTAAVIKSVQSAPGGPVSAKAFEIVPFEIDHPPLRGSWSEPGRAHAETGGCKTNAPDTDTLPKSSFLAFDPPGGRVYPLKTIVPPDVVACQQCLDEFCDTGDRRHRYPFTSCAECGPRYSIIEAMPFERADTSMSVFPLCPRCEAEYASPADRRFHAQTIACAECGPQIWIEDAEGKVIARASDAIRAAASTIHHGRIVALRGLGGYQVLVDATSPDAVSRLRCRKRRLAKPLAVMVASLDAADEIACLNDTAREVINSRAGPIVIAPLRQPAQIASTVMTDHPSASRAMIGLMLPTTPLHHLLLGATGRPLVCTSGNLEGEPISYEPSDASSRLAGVADLWLHHDRPIVRPVDDSVVRVMANRPVVIRSARGFAPRRLELPHSEPSIALGGQQKTAIAISNGEQAVLGPHIGDLDNLATRQRWIEHIDDLSRLYGVTDGGKIADLHPDYFSIQCFSRQGAERSSTRLQRVQHHHAHIAAGMLEHGWLDREVLGVAMDGTGYGADGMIWGGEFLRVSPRGFRRVGHLRELALVGGERAIRQPWRVATALVRDAVGGQAAAALNFQTGNAASLLPVLMRPALAPPTTSAGRLFDGVAALVLGIEQCDFEGQAAMLLEAACEPTEPDTYPFDIQDGQTLQLDWRPLIKRVMADRARGVAPSAMAMRFHRGLAVAIFRVARRYESLPVVLGGGVFQNRVLVELLVEMFAEVSQPMRFPVIIPPGDGGLAAGQLAVAAAAGGRR